MLKTITAVTTLAITASVIAFSYAANAEGPTQRNGSPLTAAGTNDCHTAVWPHFGEGCLYTIEGNPSDRQFRTVGS